MPQSTSKLSRRTLFAGAGTVGALATVAAVLPGTKEAAADLLKAPKQPPERGGGYELSEHVQRYYRTTRV